MADGLDADLVDGEPARILGILDVGNGDGITGIHAGILNKTATTQAP
jgi:hypothetical protein